MYRNIDVFVEQPDTHKSILCGACGVECAVERNKMGKQTFLGGRVLMMFSPALMPKRTGIRRR
jgi:hypothetical protein